MFRLYGRQGLYACIVISLLLANLQGPKLIIIFGLQTSMGVILYSSIYFATDVLNEIYGYREANRAVLIGFFVSVMIIIMTSISLMYLPSTKTADFTKSVHEATQTLFNFTPRFILGSLLAYFISQRLDVYLFHRLKEKTAGRKLRLRNNVSTLMSQAVDTVIYSLVVWWGVVDLLIAIQLALAKYVFKIVIAIVDTPFIYWARRWDVSHRDWVDSNG